MLGIAMAVVLAAHGIGHAIGVAGGWAGNAWGGSGESWLLSPALGRLTGVVEGVIWLVPALLFIAAAGAVAGGLDLWRALAVAGALTSLLAIGLFPMQLQTSSLIGAVVINAGVLVSLLVLRWPAAEALAR